MSLIAAMSRRYHRTVIHSARVRLLFHHRKRVSPGNATTNKRHPRTKREVRGAPNPISRKGGMPTRGIPPFLELLMGFGSRLRARSSAALTAHRAVIHYRSPPNPISKKLSHPQGMREFSGAANGIRTHDLVITNDVLYRLSYSSVSNA